MYFILLLLKIIFIHCPLFITQLLLEWDLMASKEKWLKDLVCVLQNNCSVLIWHRQCSLIYVQFYVEFQKKNYRMVVLVDPTYSLKNCSCANSNLPGSNPIAKPHVFGHRSHKCTWQLGVADQVCNMFQCLKLTVIFSCLGLYFILQVYSASPIFGVEFETEEKVHKFNKFLIFLKANLFKVFPHPKSWAEFLQSLMLWKITSSSNVNWLIRKSWPCTYLA